MQQIRGFSLAFIWCSLIAEIDKNSGRRARGLFIWMTFPFLSVSKLTLFV